MTPALLSSRSPDDCFFSPWHDRHCSTRIGRTLLSKNSIASAVGLGAPANAGAVRQQTRRQTRRRMELLLPRNLGGVGDEAAGEAGRLAGCLHSRGNPAF